MLAHARGHGKRQFIHVVTYLSARLRHSKCITVPGGVGVIVGPTVTHTHNTLQNKHILIVCFQNIKRRIYQALHRIMLSQVHERQKQTAYSVASSDSQTTRLLNGGMAHNLAHLPAVDFKDVYWHLDCSDIITYLHSHSDHRAV